MSERSKGVNIKFLLLGFVGLLVVTYVFFANTIIKLVLESKLGESYGAEVNIGSVDHSLYPTTVSLTQIALTNPHQPTRNQVVVGEANADVELASLLSEPIIVNSLSVLDVKFDQARESEGDVYRPPSPPLTFADIKQQATDAIPTVDELLARSPLQTLTAVEQAKSTYETYSTSIEESYKALPTEARIEEYKAQIEALKSTNLRDPQALLAATNTLDELKTAISTDKDIIAAFTQNTKEAQQVIRQHLNAINEARQQDYALLQGALMGDQAMLSQVTYMVFGDKAAEYTQYLTSALQIVMPLVQGNDEVQEATAPAPAVLVKQADVSMQWQDERITSSWQNITNAHAVTGQPTTFTIDAAGNLLKQFSSNGQFWMDENGIDAEQVWSLAGLAMEDVSLSDSDSLNALLKSALVETVGSINIVDNAVSGGGNIDLSELIMEAAGQSDVTSAVAGALQALNHLSMDMTLNGTVDQPGFSISSDLDGQLAQLAMSALSASQKDKIDELKAKINAVGADEFAALSGQLGDITSMLSGANADNNALQSLLETQLDGLINENSIFDVLKRGLGQED